MTFFETRQFDVNNWKRAGFSYKDGVDYFNRTWMAIPIQLRFRILSNVKNKMYGS